MPHPTAHSLPLTPYLLIDAGTTVPCNDNCQMGIDSYFDFLFRARVLLTRIYRRLEVAIFVGTWPKLVYSYIWQRTNNESFVFLYHSYQGYRKCTEREKYDRCCRGSLTDHNPPSLPIHVLAQLHKRSRFVQVREVYRGHGNLQKAT